MLSHLLTDAREQAKQTAGTAAIGLFATTALCVGIAFWTAAGWMVLALITTPLHAMMILGAVYTGAGLIGFFVASVRSSKAVPPPPPPQPTATFDAIVASFMSGMNAGSRARSGRSTKI